ncbi:MAG: hypothetical protein U0636_11830 [Phycisphaerales bacterium]
MQRKHSSGTNVLSADISASGAITLNGATTLTGAARTLTSSSGAVTFGSVNSATALTVDAASLLHSSGVVGGTNALASLTVLGATALNGGSVTTTGQQVRRHHPGRQHHADQHRRLQRDRLQQHAGWRPHADLSSTGATTFAGAVGGTTALTSISASGPVVFAGGSVRTTGAQSYGASTLANDLFLTSTGGSGIAAFTSTLNGAHALSTSTTGTTTFGGVVGGVDALDSISILVGTTALNSAGVYHRRAEALPHLRWAPTSALTSGTRHHLQRHRQRRARAGGERRRHRHLPGHGGQLRRSPRW